MIAALVHRRYKSWKPDVDLVTLILRDRVSDIKHYVLNEVLYYKHMSYQDIEKLIDNIEYYNIEMKKRHSVTKIHGYTTNKVNDSLGSRTRREPSGKNKRSTNRNGGKKKQSITGRKKANNRASNNKKRMDTSINRTSNISRPFPCSRNNNNNQQRMKNSDKIVTILLSGEDVKVTIKSDVGRQNKYYVQMVQHSTTAKFNHIHNIDKDRITCEINKDVNRKGEIKFKKVHERKNNDSFRVEMDTGAYRSIINKTYVKTRRIPTKMSGEKIVEALHGSDHKQTETCNMLVEINGVLLYHEFLVLDLAQPKTMMLIGKDLIDKVKIKINNIPNEFINVNIIHEKRAKELSGKFGNNHNILVPVTIDDYPVYAILDTGADKSVMSESLVNKLKLKKEPSDYKVSLATKDSEINEVSVCKHTISTTNKTIEHEFVVINMANEIEMLIGSDLYPSLGIEIHNVPIQFNDISTDMQRNKGFPSDSKKFYKCTVDESVVDKFLEDRKIVMNEIIDELEANNLIIPGQGYKTELAQVSLPLKDETPIWTPNRQVPKAIEAIIDAKIEDLLDRYIILFAPINSRWNMCLQHAAKRDEDGQWTKVRMCVDARPLNKRLQKEPYYMPNNWDNILEKAAGKKYFSCIDLWESFYNLIIKEEDRIKTTFTWKGVKYMWRCCPFGISNIPFYQQRCLYLKTI